MELYETGGHTADGAAFWIPWLGVLCCGDYISPVEIPMISPGGSLDAYQATLGRLATLVERSKTVVPGHGGPLSADQARHRYVFFAAPGYGAGRQLDLEKNAGGIQVYAVEP